MSEVRVAVFGNGFARSVILPCLRQVPGTRVVGLASPNLERARSTAAEFGIDAVAGDHREILDRCPVDLVFIATPPHRHREQSIDALEAGCHVVCEKPTAMDASESAAMVAASRMRPTQLALIDHELRFSPARAALREAISSGRLGAIRHAAYTLHSPGRRDPASPWTWWSERSCGGGALGAIGSHAVDSLRVLLGEVAETRGTLATFVPERTDPLTGRLRPVTTDDFAAAWLRFRSGTLATITISLVEADRLHRMTTAGSLGSALVEEQAPLRTQSGAGPWETASDDGDLPSSADLGIPDTDWSRSFLRYARRIVESIREGRPGVEGASTFEDGHRNQQVLDAIRASSGQEGWIAVATE